MADAPPINLAALQKLTEAGYNFYRHAARQRADDLFVRARAADALARAAGRLAEDAQMLRRALPAPSRESPFPDAAKLAAIADIRDNLARIAVLETRLRGAAALPDRDYSAINASPAHCSRLVALDAALLTEAEAPDVEKRLEAVQAVLDERAALAAWSPSP